MIYQSWRSVSRKLHFGGNVASSGGETVFSEGGGQVIQFVGRRPSLELASGAFKDLAPHPFLCLPPS